MKNTSRGHWSFNQIYYYCMSLFIFIFFWVLIFEYFKLMIMYQYLSQLRILMDRVAERLRHGTQDPGVWGSIPRAPVRCKRLGQALNLHSLWPPSSNGHLVHRFKVGSIVALSSPRERYSLMIIA